MVLPRGAVGFYLQCVTAVFLGHTHLHFYAISTKGSRTTHQICTYGACYLDHFLAA